MKHVNLSLIGIALALSIGVCQAQPQTNTITTPGGAFVFSVNGVTGNPTINLTAGVTNLLIINTTVGEHPVIITTNPTPSTTFDFVGASPQNITTGNMELQTPTTGFPTTLYYFCRIHGFGGQIDITAPVGQTPPPNTILQIKVGSNIVMTSTGTNTTWTLVPMYSTNIANQLWTPVPGYTNSFANGTNTTVFNRLDSIAGPKVYLRLSQQPN